ALRKGHGRARPADRGGVEAGGEPRGRRAARRSEPGREEAGAAGRDLPRWPQPRDPFATVDTGGAGAQGRGGWVGAASSAVMERGEKREEGLSLTEAAANGRFSPRS